MKQSRITYEPIFLLIVMILFSSCGGKSKIVDKPNILLITVDTLRRDHLGVYGYPRETSPFMDKLAKEGVMFKHVVTPQPQTLGSHASILTSLHPLTHGLIFNSLRLNQKVRTLAEELKENGYYTVGTVSTVILSRKRHFSQGFDSFSDQWEKDPEHKFEGNSQRTGQSVNRSLFRQINEYRSHHSDKPLFIWVHYYDPHRPYIGRDHITFQNKLPGDKETNENILKYDQEIHYTDKAVEELYRFLETKDIARRLVTCITSDHGEEFGEHGAMGGHNDFYAETTHVPLIFHGTGIPGNQVIDTYVSTMDIGVTLLGRAGTAFGYRTEGIDLLKGISGNSSKLPGKRKFLVIGTQKFARSLQLIGAPFSFILNLDRHYVHWYVSTLSPNGPSMPVIEKRLEPVPVKNIQREGRKLTVSLPRLRAKGLNYIVVRWEVENKTPGKSKLTVKMETYPNFQTNPAHVPVVPRTTDSYRPQTVEVIYPVTIVDRLYLEVKEGAGAAVTNPRVAFISAKEGIAPLDRKWVVLGKKSQKSSPVPDADEQGVIQKKI
ncbi:MAG: sulfatase, partial [bacterium]|nr:sulfatase [bacterium]